MTNEQIYTLAIKFQKEFNSYTKYLPAKINFYIQKNRELLLKAYEDIEKIRLNVFNKYGTYNTEEKSFSFKTEQIEDINNELDDFKNIQYDINFVKIKLSDLEGLEFTLEQMEALMFMIEED